MQSEGLLLDATFPCTRYSSRRRSLHRCGTSTEEPRRSRLQTGCVHLFMRMKRTLEPNFSRVYTTCSAIRSRKVLPSLTGRSDFAFSRPIDVPSPPFSFRTAVCSRRLCAGHATAYQPWAKLMLWHALSGISHVTEWGILWESPENPFQGLVRPDGALIIPQDIYCQ